MLQIGSANTIVHPWAVMVHPADAAVADTAVMGHGRLEGLTLAAHAVRILHEALTF